MKISYTMATKRPLVLKNSHDVDKPELPEIALAAFVSYKRQKEISDFINFVLDALERNSHWLNTIASRQNSFKCALMEGAGPGRFQLKDIIYPSKGTFKIEVEMKESKEHDKIGIAALLRLKPQDVEYLMKFIRGGMFNNTLLREDLQQGNTLGLTYAVLKPISDKQYRVIETIVVKKSLKSIIVKKPNVNDGLIGPPCKKVRKV